MRTKEAGKLFVIAAPSGAGKTSLVHALMERDARLQFSISFTTRPRRPTEIHGRDYFFVDKATFERMVADGEFLEYAQVFGNFYGTPRRQVADSLARGEQVILEIDWQGARQIRERMPQCISVFILPPSREELDRRLRSRGTDADTVIVRRLQESIGDISHWKEFDYVVINDDFDRALAELQAIVSGRGAAQRRDRPELEAFVATHLA
jgi:guanylate kinase